VNRFSNINTTPQELRRLEVEIFEAIKSKNITALSRLLYDHFSFRSPGEDPVNKEDFLKLIAAIPVKYVALWGEELRVNVFADTAIVTGIQLSKTRDNDGAEEIMAVSFTDVFVNRHGRWMLALTHTTDLEEVPEKYRAENRAEN
jgi:ketosteroid isomerase-like protein